MKMNSDKCHLFNSRDKFEIHGLKKEIIEYGKLEQPNSYV